MCDVKHSDGMESAPHEVAEEDVMSHCLRSVLVLLAAAALCLTLVDPVNAVGNAKRGQRIAEKWCATCHQIVPGALRFDKSRPASFQEIADTPGMGEMALKVFFQTPHKKMPNFSITGDVRDDLIAYITGLRHD